MFRVWLLLLQLKAACDDPGVNLIQTFFKDWPVHINTGDIRAYADPAYQHEGTRLQGGRLRTIITRVCALRNHADLFIKDKSEHGARAASCV